MSTHIRQTKSDRVFDIINVTLLIGVLIIVLYPLVFVVSASFSNSMAVMQGKVRLWPIGFNIESYRAVFQNSKIITGYKNTIIYTLVGTAVNIVMTIAGAYPLSRKDFVGRNIIMMYITFTMFFGGGLIPSYIINKSLGLVNNFWVMILPGAVSVWNLIVMRSFFQNSIPVELQEAAFIDGCSNFNLLFKIVLPLSAPIIAVMVIFYGVGHWNAFFTALIYFKEQKRFPLQLVLREILIQNDMQDMTGDGTLLAQQLLAESIKYSVIIVSSLPVLMLYPFLQKYFVKGVMVGAIKG
jgi:putative aldouronate transport system permease protein